MSIFKKVSFFVDDWEARKDYLAYNEVLLDIYEGNLYPYLDADLKAQLGEQSYKQARHRIASINVLTKIIDKKSKIYQEAPSRTVSDGSKADKELLSWYERSCQTNAKMNVANEYFNLKKACLIEPFVSQGKPGIRSIKGDRFLVYSFDPTDPTRATHVLVEDGSYKEGDEQVTLFRAYSDTEFVLFNSKKEVLYQRMAMLENDQGINPVGALPFIYVNKSNSNVMPKQDSDTLAMTKLIPLMLTDLNFVSMFSCFSILYMIDSDDENLERAPNAVWKMKSDPNSERKPEIGVIKPQADIQATLGLIQAQFALWLNTKGIRPGAVGQLTPDNMVSGISKMVDEGDATDDRKEQVEQFRPAENQLWELMLKRMHPVWIKQALIENTHHFTATAKVETNFAPQVAMVRRADTIAECKQEVEAGFTSRRRAIKKLNPQMTDDEITELIAEIDGERPIELAVSTREPQTIEAK